MTDGAQVNEIEATVDQDKATVEIGHARIEVTPAGKVTIISDKLLAKDVQRKPAVEAGADFSIDDKGFSVYGVKVEFSPEGGFTVYTNNEVQMKPATPPLRIGQKTEDGIFAGLTEDGKQQIFAMPEDLHVKGSFNEAAEAIKWLNSDIKANHGHGDWQIGSLEVVQIVRRNLAEGPLRDSFKEAFSIDRYYQNRTLPQKAYWGLTSTRDKLYPSQVATVRFTDGDGFKPGAVRFESDKAGKFGCRPVRLKPVPGT